MLSLRLIYREGVHSPDEDTMRCQPTHGRRARWKFHATKMPLQAANLGRQGSAKTLPAHTQAQDRTRRKQKPRQAAVLVLDRLLRTKQQQQHTQLSPASLPLTLASQRLYPTKVPLYSATDAE